MATDHRILVDGQERSYSMVTAAPRNNGPTPELAAVLIFLHGSNQTGPKLRAFSGHSLDGLAVSGRVAVVYPNGHRSVWNHARAGAGAVDDMSFMAALVEHFHQLHGLLPVIAAGYSNGGQLVIRMIHEIPGKLDGAAIFSATLPRSGGLAFADKQQPMPVVLIHGTRDLVVPYNGDAGFLGLGFRNRGPSAPETARYFAARNNITAPPLVSRLPHRAESGSTYVTLTSYAQQGRDPVKLYTVVGGGHVVPNPHKSAIFVLGRTTLDISAAQALTEAFPVLRG
ncbi:hypothetical protein AOC05_03130 [Arthrobacter alpinus]|uniref:Phospholipase/carboxylesterase/thioesterase domain-containing protein n=2 Tax=Arthrobacter TaxID=1663 RepID=A0A0M4R1C8_9MICC|nr:hypothetical protein AOC05_03130 [Arthrobacter alpinus]